MGLNSTGGTIFDVIYSVLCNFKSVRQSDRNASDWPIVKNSNRVPRILGFALG